MAFWAAGSHKCGQEAGVSDAEATIPTVVVAAAFSTAACSARVARASARGRRRQGWRGVYGRTYSRLPGLPDNPAVMAFRPWEAAANEVERGRKQVAEEVLSRQRQKGGAGV